MSCLRGLNLHGWRGWRGSTHPGHTPLASLRWLAPLSLHERGVGGVGSAGRLGRGVLVVWLVGPAPPRAYPARGASLARAPFAPRKGRWWCWFSGSAWKGCVGGLAGGPRSAPGIPRSHRFAGSRPFRAAKGALVVLVQRVGLEGVCWWFGWRAPLRPGHTQLAALRSLAPLSLCERGVGGVGSAGRLGRGVLVVWLAGPAPPRAYPARIASLARAPFALRKGRGWCWFSGSAWKGCVGGMT